MSKEMFLNTLTFYLALVSINFAFSTSLIKTDNSQQSSPKTELKPLSIHNQVLDRVVRSPYIPRPICPYNSLLNVLIKTSAYINKIVKAATSSLTYKNDTIQFEEVATDCCEIKRKIIESVCSVLQYRHLFTSSQLNKVLYHSDSLERGIQFQSNSLQISRFKRFSRKQKTSRAKYYFVYYKQLKINYEKKCNELGITSFSSPFPYSIHLMSFFQRCQTCTSQRLC